MRSIISCLFILISVSCNTTKIYRGGFYFPEPCSLVEKEDICSFYDELKQDEIQISISLDMTEHTKLCAYNWVDDYKRNFIMDIYLTGKENFQGNHPKGKISYFSIGQHNPEEINLGDAAVFIPKLHDKEFQRLAILKGNFVLELQTKNIEKSTILEFAEIALSKMPE